MPRSLSPEFWETGGLRLMRNGKSDWGARQQSSTSPLSVRHANQTTVKVLTCKCGSGSAGRGSLFRDALRQDLASPG